MSRIKYNWIECRSQYAPGIPDKMLACIAEDSISVALVRLTSPAVTRWRRP